MVYKRNGALGARSMEKTACPLCGERKEKALFVKDNFKVVRCTNCTLTYVNPRLDKKAIAESYNKNTISPKEYYLRSEAADRIAFKKRWKIIERFTSSRGRVLDIGCNIGIFLSVAKENGWDCYGIDINKSVEKECKQKGIKFAATTLERAKFKKEYFDVIILNDVIEHVHEPKKLMLLVKQFLKKGGIVFLVTPDIGSVTAKVMRRRWHHLKPDEHLTYFTQATMKRLLNDAGLSVLYAKRLGRERSLGIILEKAGSMLKVIPKTKRMVPKSLQKMVIPLNTFDELGVVARKN